MSADDPSAGLEDAVRLLYEAYPYPAANQGTATLPELAALLRMFFLENRARPDGARLLDVGTGSGNRLLGAAEKIPSLSLVGLDFSASSIAMARRLTQQIGLDTRHPPVDFVEGDLLSEDTIRRLGDGWDFITCMGVLHHIPRRAQALANLARLLKADGYLFIYVYGTLGSADRLLAKELIRMLRQDPHDREDGLTVAKALALKVDGYGWLTDPDSRISADESTRDISLVDALLHDYETTFTIRGLARELADAGFEWCSVTGMTAADRAHLVDCDWRAGGSDTGGRQTHTTSATICSSPLLLERFRRLPTLERLEVIEKLYKPNGYSVVVGRSQAAAARLGRRLAGTRIDFTG